MRNKYKVLGEMYEQKVVEVSWAPKVTSDFIHRFKPSELDTTGPWGGAQEMQALRDYIDKQGAEWYAQSTGHKMVGSGLAALQHMASLIQQDHPEMSIEQANQAAVEEFYKQFKEWYD